MKKISLGVLLLLFVALTNTSCKVRLIDFTIISSKNHSLNLEDAMGERVTGKSMGFMGINTHVKDAVDDAIKKGGKGSDALIDGVVRAKIRPFWVGYVVEGTAVNTKKLKALLGEEGFKDWAANRNMLTIEDFNNQN